MCALRVVRRYSLVWLLAAGILGEARAQTFTWTGNGAANTWSTSGNWSGGTPTSGINTAIVFSGTTRLTADQNILNPFVLNSLTFNSGAGAFDITDLPLNFKTSGTSVLPTIVQNSSTAVTIDSGVILTNNLTYSGIGSATINGAISGAGGLTMNGSGTLTLSNASNSYSGATSILSGTLSLGANAPSGANGALGNATTTVLLGNTSGSSNASLLTNGAFTVGRNITVQAGNTGTLTLGGSNTSGTANFTGNITLNNNVNLSSASGGTVSFNTGTISGTGSVTVVGGGTVLLGGTNTYTGVTNVNGGTLSLSGTLSSNNDVNIATLSSSNGTLTVSGASAQINAAAGHMAVGSSGTGTLNILNGASVTDLHSFVGANAGSTGFATVSGTGSTWSSDYLLVGSAGSGTMTISAGGQVFTTNASQPSEIADTLGSVSSLTITGNGSKWTGSSDFYVGNAGNATLSIQSGGALSNVNAYIAANAASTSTATVTGSGSTWTSSGSLYIGSNGTQNRGNGTLTISSGGTVNVTNSLQIWAPGTLNLNSGGTITSGSISLVGGAFSLAGGTTTSPVSISSGTLTASAGSIGSLSGTGGTIGLSSGGSLTIGQATTGTFSGAISGAGALSESGAGILTLSGTNTFSGGTTIANGTIAYASDAATGGSSNGKITLNAGGIAAANFNMDQTFVNNVAAGGAASGVIALGASTSNNLSFAAANLAGASLGATGTFTYSGTLTPNGTTYRLGGGGGDLTYGGTLSGSNSLIVTSSGTGASSDVTLGTANTYTGTTSILSGALFVTANAPAGAAGALGTATSSVLLGNTSGSSGAALAVAGDFEVDRNITVQSGSTGVLELGGINTSGTSSFTGNIALNNNVYFVSTGAGVVNLTGTISGSGSVAIDGINTSGSYGTVQLFGNNTYTGTTSVLAGALAIANNAFSGSNGALGNATSAVLLGDTSGANPAAIEINGNYVVGRNITVQAGGTGALSLTGINTSGTSYFTGNVTLNNNVFLGAAGAGVTDFQGNTSGAGSIAVLGLNVGGSYGVVQLDGNNSYTGSTAIDAGTLRAHDGVGLPTASTLFFNGSTLSGGIPNGGILETSGNFTRSIGAGVGQVYWAGNGGFSAQGGTLNVQLNGNASSVTFGVGGFVPSGGVLLLNSATSDSLVNFQNGLNLAGTYQVINVGDNPNTTNDLAQISGVISNGNLVKDGAGTLILSASNTYSGITQIDSGTLRATDGVSLPSASPVLFVGGILETSGTFARSVGTGSGQVSWATSGGFSAQGGTLNVQLNGNTNTVTFGSGGFVPSGGTLLLNTTTSDSLLNFQNGLNLAGAAQYINVGDNPYTTNDLVQISGVISNGGLFVFGPGTLILSAANTYTGVTYLESGTLRATDGVGLPTASALYILGGVFETHGTFNRSLGSGIGQVQWGNAGGFSAQGGTLNVQLNGNTSAVTFGSGGFVPSGYALQLNTTTSDSLLNFQNGLNLAGAYQYINVGDNPYTTNDLAQISGVISNGGLVVNGPGTLILSAANTYTAQTYLESGTLRATDGVGLPTASNLYILGGVFETNGTFNRSLGAGAAQVQWGYTGGFSAQGGVLNVQLNGNTSAVTFGSGGFVPSGYALQLNTTTSDSLVNFQNGLNLAGGVQFINVDDNPNTANDLAQISGVISNGYLVKEGAGTLILSAADTYSGWTEIVGGTLRAADGVGLPTASTLFIAGGVLETNGTFNRSLGSGAGQVDWLGSGGFSAQGGTLNVQLNGNTNTVTFGSGGFVPSGGTLQLNTTTSDSLVNFQNGLNLAGWYQNINVGDNPNSTSDLAQVSGIISNGLLVKVGDGTLVLTGANNFGELLIDGGVVRATDGVGLPTASNLYILGGVFETNGTFNRSLGAGAAQVQWGYTGGFSAQGGTLNVQLNGNTSAVTFGSGGFVPSGYALQLNTTTSDSLVNFQNGLNLAGTFQYINVGDNPNSTSDLAQVSGIISNGFELVKVGGGTLILTGANNFGELLIDGGVVRAADGIGLPVASVLDFAGGVLETNGTFSRTVGFSAGQVDWATSGGFSAQGGTLNVQLNGNTNTVTWGGAFVPNGSSLMFGSVLADSLVNFQNGIDLNGGNRTINVTGNPNSPTDFAQISGVISNGAITKTGGGSLILSAANSYTGTTSILGGTVITAANAPAGANGPLGNANSAVLVGDTSGAVNSGLLTSGAFTIGRDITLQAGNSGTATLGGTNASGTANFTGNILLNHDVILTASAGGSVSFNTGTISGNGNLTVNGTGTVVLAGTNSYTGTTAVLDGTLAIGAAAPSGTNGALGNATSAVLLGDVSGANSASLLINGAFTVGRNITVQAGSSGTMTLGGLNASGTASFTGNVVLNQNVSVTSAAGGTVSFTTGSISGAGGITTVGTGTVVLQNANTFTGGTNVTSGTVAFGSDAATGGSSNGKIALSANGTVAANFNMDQTFINNIAAGGAASGIIALGANSTNNLSLAAANLAGVSLGSIGAFTYSGTLTPNGTTYQLGGGGGNLTISSALAGANNVVIGSNPLAANSIVTLTSNSNTYTGTTAIDSGTLQLGTSQGSLPNTTAVTLANTAGATLSTNGRLLQIGSLTGGGAIGGNVALAGGSLFTGYANTSTTFAGVISGNGSVAKVGTGTWTVSGSNTYNGTTEIGNGTLQLGAVNALPTTTSLALDKGGVFDLNGFNQTIGLFASDGSKGGTIQSSIPAILTTDGNSSLIYCNILGNVGITKNGSGTLNLSFNDLDFSGTINLTRPITVNSGALNINASSITSAVVMANVAGATLQLEGLPASLSLGSLSGGGNLGGSILLLNNSATVGSDNTSQIYSGVLSGSSALSKIGSGDQTFAGVNTYSGQTSILAGTLTLGTDAPKGANGALGNATSAVLLGDASGTNSASLLVNGAFTVGRDITIQAGSSGTMTIGGTNASGVVNFTGNILINHNATFTAAPGGVVSFNTGTISGTGGVSIAGGGTVDLVGINSFTGTTQVLANTTLELNASLAHSQLTIASTGQVNLLNGATLDVTGSLLVNNGNVTGTVNADSGGVIKGSGTFTIGNINAGGTVSPGNSPGTQTYSSMTWNSGGHYVWEINQLAVNGGTAGHDPGWDLLNAGTLSITGPFSINVTSLALSNTAGALNLWNPNGTYQWLIATATNHEFSTGDFGNLSVTTSAFSVYNTVSGNFSLQSSGDGDSLFLDYTPSAVPEPSSLVLSLLAVAPVGWSLLRRGRAQPGPASTATLPDNA